MKSPTLIRNVGIGILVLVVIAGAYIFLVSDDTSNEKLLTKNVESSDVVLGVSPQKGVVIEGSQNLMEITSILNELKSISIDGSLFESPVFRSLTDFHLDIPSQPKGRTNPFLIGEGVKTSQPRK